MIDLNEITWLHWTVFLGAILFFLALDLGIFHRRSRVVKFGEAFGWTFFWFALAMAFAFVIVPNDSESGLVSGPRAEFITGYVLELSLSMDNVFVIALIFGYFQVRLCYQHRVLYWGILGALVMRGLMIGLGAALVSQFEWILYFFGGFLVITGGRMMFTDDEGIHPGRNPVVRLARRFFPVGDEFDGQHFITRIDGRLIFTPLALVLLVVETTDLVFAVDSIPAIFGVTKDTFVVFSSNVFAILGLRSLYFVLAGMIDYFRYLKFGLSIVLVYIGGKMLAEIWHVSIPTIISLGIIVGIILASILLSLAVRRWGTQTQKESNEGE